MENGEAAFSKRDKGKVLESFEADSSESCRARVEAKEITASTAANYAESFTALWDALGAHLVDEIDGQAVRRAFAEITGFAHVVIAWSCNPPDQEVGPLTHHSQRDGRPGSAILPARRAGLRVPQANLRQRSFAK